MYLKIQISGKNGRIVDFKKQFVCLNQDCSKVYTLQLVAISLESFLIFMLPLPLSHAGFHGLFFLAIYL